jgi:hypothetical protein
MAHNTDCRWWEASSVFCQTRRLAPSSLKSSVSGHPLATSSHWSQIHTRQNSNFNQNDVQSRVIRFRSSKYHLAECQLLPKSSLSPDKGFNELLSRATCLWRNRPPFVNPLAGERVHSEIRVGRLSNSRPSKGKKEMPLRRTLPFAPSNRFLHSNESKSFNHLKLSLVSNSHRHSYRFNRTEFHLRSGCVLL